MALYGGCDILSIFFGDLWEHDVTCEKAWSRDIHWGLLVNWGDLAVALIYLPRLRPGLPVSITHTPHLSVISCSWHGFTQRRCAQWIHP
jgi:hypothetical protein